MLLRVTHLTLLLSLAMASEDLFQILGGSQGLNEVVVCAGDAQCDGALWGPQWAVARASCVIAMNWRNIGVVRRADGLSCSNFYRGGRILRARQVRKRFLHPKFRFRPEKDLVLLFLDAPFALLENLDNRTYVDNMLRDFEPWMRGEYRQQEIESKQRHSHYMEFRNTLFTSAFQMFATTVLLPTFSFIAFFMFVIFCTGSHEEIPYKSINSDKEDSVGV